MTTWLLSSDEDSFNLRPTNDCVGGGLITLDKAHTLELGPLKKDYLSFTYGVGKVKLPVNVDEDLRKDLIGGAK